MSKINYKFILLGNSGVWKTSIFRYLSTGVFSENNISTLGIEKKTLYYSYEIEEKEKNKNKIKIKKIMKDFTISLFDTAGQEKFRSITLNYYKLAEGILLLYDITDRASFDSVETWINQIKDAIGAKDGAKYVIILVGNKFDLVKEDESNRKVKEEEAQNACEKYNIIWGGEQSIKAIQFDELNKLFEKYVKIVYNYIGETNTGKQKEKKVENYKKRTRCRLL